MTTHSSILAWRTPWTEEQAGYSPWGSQSQTQLVVHTHTHHYLSNFLDNTLNVDFKK